MNSRIINIDKFEALPGQKVKLDQFETDSHEGYEDKKEAKQQLKEDIKLLSELQYQLYAENRRALLIVFQAMDAGGKDSAIRHIIPGEDKRFSRVVIGNIIVHTLKEMEIKMPEISEDEIEAMKQAKQELLED
jgi:polyphosphate kinase 2 (PPK2 family)